MHLMLKSIIQLFKSRSIYEEKINSLLVDLKILPEDHKENNPGKKKCFRTGLADLLMKP